MPAFDILKMELHRQHFEEHNPTRWILQQDGLSISETKRLGKPNATSFRKYTDSSFVTDLFRGTETYSSPAFLGSRTY